MVSHKDQKHLSVDEIYRNCKRIIGSARWQEMVSRCEGCTVPETFIKDNIIADVSGAPEYIGDLARLEFAVYQASDHGSIEQEAGSLTLNPTLQLLELEWSNLVSLIRDNASDANNIKPAPEKLLVFRKPQDGKTTIQPATDEDLLVLKMVAEKISAEDVAQIGDIPLIVINEAIDRAHRRGILLKPPSLIRRDQKLFDRGPTFASYQEPSIFTLQWHITQACDLHCKHCYDRSSRKFLDYEQGLLILDDLDEFCRSRNVRGQVTFTGGNPLLHPRFLDLYKEAVNRGFRTAILGNPATQKEVEDLIAIQRPEFYQISLEGLEEHTDFIRGKGHFQRSLAFLSVLRELGIYSMVMLTLTKENLSQVLALGELLRDRTDLFTFNRLATVGEGAQLEAADKAEFIDFLEKYITAAAKNPVMKLKDNLFNIHLQRQGLSPFGGCAGFGCGAAFNFAAVLSDGEVHACRKFPSPIGNVFKHSFSEIYDSALAEKYRAGSRSCSDCSIRPVCGGCLAVVYSNGLNVFEDRDPYCFIS